MPLFSTGYGPTGTVPGQERGPVDGRALGIAAESPQRARFFSGARGLAAQSPTPDFSSGGTP